jgi:hypothetical protein
MQLFDDVAYGDLEQGSIYERSEANLTKVNGPAATCCLAAGLHRQSLEEVRW